MSEIIRITTERGGQILDGILIDGTFKYFPTIFMHIYAISILSVTKQDTRYIPQNVDSHNRRLPDLCIMLSKSSSLVHPSCIRGLTEGK